MSKRSRWKVIASTVTLGLMALAILAGPSMAVAWRDWRAERLVEQGRLAEAEAEVRRLIQDTPDRPRPRLLLARIVREQGRITEAEEILQRAVELGLDIERARVEHASIHSKIKTTARPD